MAFAGYFLFGGLKLLARSERVEVESEPRQTLDRHQVLTLVVIGTLIVGVVFFKFNIGMAAFAGAVLLALLRAADDGEAIKRMPWSTIVMVCGVTVLIGLREKTGGMTIFTDLLSSIATQQTVLPELAVRLRAGHRGRQQREHAEETECQNMQASGGSCVSHR